MASDSSGRNNKNDSFSSLLKSMGGDGCDRPACDDTKSALSAALKRVGMSRGSAAAGGEASSDTGGASSGSTTKQEQKGRIPNSYNACPPTKDAIGACTWSLVHSMVRCQFRVFELEQIVRRSSIIEFACIDYLGSMVS
jgi:hypothetical protein